MLTKEFKVPFAEGLHARPASQITSLCKGLKSSLKFKKGELVIDPKSILGIMTLGAKKDDIIIATADGEDEQAAMEALENFFSSH